MKISDFTNEDVLDYLKVTDFENFFTVHQDMNNRYFYNLNSTVCFNGPTDNLPTFVCTSRMHWPLVSYHIYGTTHLAWLLMKLNKVSAADVFNALQPGDKVKYLNQNTAEQLVTNINKADN